MKSTLENSSQEGFKYKYSLELEQGVSYITICLINQVNDLTCLNVYLYAEPIPEPSTKPVDRAKINYSLRLYLRYCF